MARMTFITGTHDAMHMRRMMQLVSKLIQKAYDEGVHLDAPEETELHGYLHEFDKELSKAR